MSTPAARTPHAPPDDEVEHSRMSLGEHIAELRKRLIRALLAIGVAFIGVYSYRHAAFEFVQGPGAWAAEKLNQDQLAAVELLLAEAPPGTEAADPATYFEFGYPDRKVLNDRWRYEEGLLVTGADMGFLAKIRVSLWLALFLAGPYALWEAWGFVAAGLYKHERKVVYRYFPASLGLFLGGVVFGYMVMVPYALYFLGLDGIGLMTLNVKMGISEYLGFLKSLALGLGIVFQLPVVMVVFARLGLISPAAFAKYRKHTIVGALIVGAILTPPDPYTQVMMAGPMIILYEIGIHLSRFALRSQARAAAASGAAT